MKNRKLFYQCSSITSESGRSMVEMLGTLALVGVLSVVGLAVYGVAMDKHRANTLLNEAQKRATVIVSQIGLFGYPPTLSDFGEKENTNIGGIFSSEIIQLNGQFGIQVSGVKERVCDNLLKMIGPTTSIRYISLPATPATAIRSCSAGENDYVMVYNNPNLQACSVDDDCQTVCGICDNNVCARECPSVLNECESKSDCPGDCTGCVKESGATKGVCKACEPLEYLESTGAGQHINTNIYINDSDNLTAEYIITYTNPSSRQLQGYSSLQRGYWGINANGYYEMGATQTSLQPQEKDFIIFDKKVGNKFNYKLFVNNNLAVSASATTRESGTFRLLSLGGGYLTRAKLYSMRLYVNDKQVRNFIPVYAPYKEAKKQNCLFDRVSKGLFCNAGTGNDFKTNKTP